MMSKAKWGILLTIVLVGGFLRLWGLDKYPTGFTPDEAAFGYNAYSLLKTGHDEWGTPFWQLPFTNLRSFGDYKMPLYAFLTVPSVSLFGLNEFSTRLPNAVLGTLAVLVIYLLSRKLYLSSNPSPKLGEGNKRGEVLALLGSIFLAISPWAFPLSRGAFEANLITLFLPLAVVLFLSNHLVLSTLLLALSLYSYHSARLITPLVLIGLFIFYKPKIRKILLHLILLLLLFTPVFYSLIFSNQRVADVSIFHPDDNWATMATRRLELINSGWSPFTARLVSNKLIYSGSVFFKNYLSYFHFNFLFKYGPREATYGMLPGTGVVYWIQIIGFSGFVLMLFKNNKDSRLLFTAYCLLISVIPAALSKGPGLAANRAAFMIIPLTIMSAIGIGYFFRNILKSLSQISIMVIIFLITLESVFFIKKYLISSPLIHSRSMGYGFSQLADYLTKNYEQYSQIKISRSLSEPHIYLAFYQKIDPKIYQQAAQSWKDFEVKGFRFWINTMAILWVNTGLGI